MTGPEPATPPEPAFDAPPFEAAAVPPEPAELEAAPAELEAAPAEPEAPPAELTASEPADPLLLAPAPALAVFTEPPLAAPAVTGAPPLQVPAAASAPPSAGVPELVDEALPAQPANASSVGKATSQAEGANARGSRMSRIQMEGQTPSGSSPESTQAGPRQEGPFQRTMHFSHAIFEALALPAIVHVPIVQTSSSISTRSRRNSEGCPFL